MDPNNRRLRAYLPESEDPFADPTERSYTSSPPELRRVPARSITLHPDIIRRDTQEHTSRYIRSTTATAPSDPDTSWFDAHALEKTFRHVTRATKSIDASTSSPGPIPISLPPLLANEKSAVELADTVDPKIIKRGKRKVWFQKQLLTLFDFSANFILIFASWYWPRYYYLYLPFISLPLVLNCIMIFMIIIYSTKNKVFKPRKIVPNTPEAMVLLMPCYNESFEECTRSLDSLTSQVNIDQHKKAIMIVCDGKVRGPGMEKTTAQYLAEDILVGRQTRRFMIRTAYLAWDGQTMDVECLTGVYKGVPFFCIIKQQNQGKRDSLIVSRSFVHHFNKRAEQPKVVFSPPFFKAMASWLQNDAGFDRVDVLIGMDADTVFETDCISHLVTESHYPQTVGVCGYVAVDFQHGNWNLWSIYQSAEYTIAQGLRRLHQSVVTHKVSCLPGCCQLLKVCEETCGDRVLIELFGYHPKPLDGVIRRIRATASEDRNHVCLMLMESPKAQTRQALRARAYTDVPHSLKVFLSQRRRWTLGATSNDLMLFTKAPWWSFNWWERIIAFSNVLTWVLNPFVIASLGCMIYAFLHQPWWIILAFAGVMIIPLLYYLTMVVWMPRNWLERGQFLLGLTIFAIVGPFINICVTIYAVKNMDNFGWGKTRQVIAETGEAEETNADEEQRRTQVALRFNEKVIGNQVPDEENQLAHVRVPNPFTVPLIPDLRRGPESPEPEPEPELELELQESDPETPYFRHDINGLRAAEDHVQEMSGALPGPARASRESLSDGHWRPMTPTAAEPYRTRGIASHAIPPRHASLGRPGHQAVETSSIGTPSVGPPVSLDTRSQSQLRTRYSQGAIFRPDDFRPR
ncbi:hypothetical protein PFICI_12982 [Pestalotiopsis fici W106-1]|uniref:chitin synthase n=1 Tax=Pestalotiopsis fici (strain W106-1 / CGMCC3.15140) TaxID=1229662 RepID=W3WQA4_PESFW|nr:uncharacterized protein PFICI_12982 [Pestalotiopsis fici W106-1]ETS76038.1 hypothetical protein PFICI_12982 [Pestalotiopsis fici W106-1]